MQRAAQFNPPHSSQQPSFIWKNRQEPQRKCVSMMSLQHASVLGGGSGDAAFSPFVMQAMRSGFTSYKRMMWSAVSWAKASASAQC
jgi:hypothetical protein